MATSTIIKVLSMLGKHWKHSVNTLNVNALIRDYVRNVMKCPLSDVTVVSTRCMPEYIVIVPIMKSSRRSEEPVVVPITNSSCMPETEDVVVR